MVDPMDSRPRSGTILIIVAGISGLLASLALAFLARLQANNAGGLEVMQQAQIRLTLVAACSYIQEASRIGWEHPDYTGRYHLEASGWIDVRDGAPGPKYRSSSESLAMMRNASGRPEVPETPYATQEGVLGTAMFPIGIPRRFPLYRMQRPPFAIQNRACYNPVIADPGDPDYTSLRAYKRYPDPLPAIDNGWRPSPSQPGRMETHVASSGYGIWRKGDQAPCGHTCAKAWFRLLREPAGSVFLVTVGSGGTMGWRTWEEAVADDAAMARGCFGHAVNFRAAQAEEVRQWYRLEWSPYVAATDHHLLQQHESTIDTYRTWTPNGGRDQGQFFTHNMGGTIQWIQRLREEPRNW